MINTDYFKFLVKSNRYLLLFTILISLLVGFADIDRAFICIFAVLLCFALPVISFKYIHDKKAVDTYFSLPIKRIELLNTGLLFNILSIFIPTGIAFLIEAIMYQEYSIPSILILLGITLMIISCLVLFNTMLYSIGNNVFDGVVMIGAYSALPYALLLVVYVFMEVFVCGSVSNDVDFIMNFSPLYLSIIMFIRTTGEFIISLNSVDYLYLLYLLIFIVASYLLLKHSFVNRKVERAYTSSNSFFAYPLIIYLYTFLCLFGISSNWAYSYEGIFDFLEDSLFLYIIVFILFVVANFVYKRKLYFNIKMPIFFIIVLMLSFGFGYAARLTNGFGLANSYMKNDPNVRYVIDIYTNPDSEIGEWIEDKGISSFDDYKYICIKAGKEYSSKPLNSNTVEIIEKYRKLSIKQFYSKDKHYNGDSLHINVLNNYYKDFDVESFDKEYSYNLYGTLTLEEFFTISEDPNVCIVISTGKGDYLLNSDKDLQQITYYNKYVY